MDVFYVPASLAQALPMMSRMRARLIGELHFKQDPTERSEIALRVVALGRVVGVDSWVSTPSGSRKN